jgi:hypothetical protein
MTIDERLEAVAHNLDMLTRIHLDDDREYRERFERLAEAQERLEKAQERSFRDIQALQVMAQQDGENIRALARIAELHQRGLDELEG